MLLLIFWQGPAINPIVQNDGDEPLPSLSDWHDYEPNLEFDDTELTHPATTNGKYNVSSSYSFFFLFNFSLVQVSSSYFSFYSLINMFIIFISFSTATSLFSIVINFSFMSQTKQEEEKKSNETNPFS